MIRKAVYLITLLTLLIASAYNSSGEVLDHIHFRTSSGKIYYGQSSRTYELEIDDALEIIWKSEEFITVLATSQGVVPLGDPLKERIKTLETGIKQLLEAQQRLISVKTAWFRYDAAKDTNRKEILRRKFLSANNRYAEYTLDALSALEQHKESDAELYAALNEAVNKGYNVMARVLHEHLNELGKQLAKRVQDGLDIQVYMSAILIDSGGNRAGVHLEGYDNIETGVPVPFPRFQTAVDQRTMAEIQAAQGLTKIVNDILDGTFRRELKIALNQIRDTIDDLVLILKTEVLEAQLDDIIQDLEEARDKTLGPLITELRDIRDLIVSLSNVPQLDAETDAERLLQISILLDKTIRRIAFIIRQLPVRLKALADEFEELLCNRPGIIREEIISVLRVAQKSFLEKQEYLKEVFKNLSDIAIAVELSAGVASEAIELVPRELGTNISLDSRLDLQTIRDMERHPGDRLVITIKVVTIENTFNSDNVIAQSRQSFRLEVYGFYLETRGALLFVDPCGEAEDDQSFGATPGLGFHIRLGLKNKPFWNRGLTFGLGVSIALLDFDNEKEFELGIAVSATILRDLLWIGYGRNLQAERNYFYVGINPLTLVGLIRRGSL